jgi:hypothetical protein
MGEWTNWTTWNRLYERALDGEADAIEAIENGARMGNDNAQAYLERLEKANEASRDI